jgi:hypothetical protein
MDPRWYRTRLFLDVVRLLLFPAALLAMSLHLIRLRLAGIHLLCYPIFTLLWAIAKGFYHDRTQTREARQLGAQLIPRVVGRWPGNVDVLVRILHSTKTGHLYDVYLELFDEYKATTLNLRIFWIDHVSRCPYLHPLFPSTFEHCLMPALVVNHNGPRTHQVHSFYRVREVLERERTKRKNVGNFPSFSIHSSTKPVS